jgi:hypothetical protein
MNSASSEYWKENVNIRRGREDGEKKKNRKERVGEGI